MAIELYAMNGGYARKDLGVLVFAGYFKFNPQDGAISEGQLIDYFGPLDIFGKIKSDKDNSWLVLEGNGNGTKVSFNLTERCNGAYLGNRTEGNHRDACTCRLYSIGDDASRLIGSSSIVVIDPLKVVGTDELLDRVVGKHLFREPTNISLRG